MKKKVSVTELSSLVELADKSAIEVACVQNGHHGIGFINSAKAAVSGPEVKSARPKLQK